ncbi:monocyte to macrophage differentiation protein, putative [Pediculus humanus corporis]|uniref:Monocyte to macrophage differentiation protein, putative n=1 Tax=Pediculus humanus subsp. corporis TaxID=121224 RepID=E0VTA7_PEDHC|nr:monocyte to macrophage differentiation protein, putative [Pediculus humanus corporis]EEB16613.1 monocyte to macrophage differentiation protein, putative [Pediculus humanus corporis]
MFCQVKKFWKDAIANINYEQLQQIKWKNCRAAPNSAYIPTTIEHCANVLTHGVWVVPSILGFLNLIERSQNFAQFWAALIYGASLILIFTVSTSFHCVFFCSRDRQLKDFLHRCDRAVIYIFIAASYFPWVTLRSSPEGTIAKHLSWIIWVLAFCGISYQQIFHEKYKRLETFFYVFMGVAPALVVLNNWTDLSGFQELQLGGILYGIGIIFFKLDGAVPCAHAVWHLFVAVAAGIHYRAILHHLFPPVVPFKN